MIRINLLEGTAREVVEIPSEPASPAAIQAQTLVGGLIVAAGLVVGAHWLLSQRLDGLNRQIGTEKAEAARLSAIQAQNARYSAQLQDINRRIDVLQLLQSNRHGPSQLMTQLATTVNGAPELYLMSVTPQQGGRISLTGASNSVSSIATLLGSLQPADGFNGVQLREYYEDDEKDGRVAYKFALDFSHSASNGSTSAPGPPAPVKQTSAAGSPAGLPIIQPVANSTKKPVLVPSAQAAATQGKQVPPAVAKRPEPIAAKPGTFAPAKPGESPSGKPVVPTATKRNPAPGEVHAVPGKPVPLTGTKQAPPIVKQGSAAANGTNQGTAVSTRQVPAFATKQMSPVPKQGSATASVPKQITPASSKPASVSGTAKAPAVVKQVSAAVSAGNKGTASPGKQAPVAGTKPTPAGKQSSPASGGTSQTPPVSGKQGPAAVRAPNQGSHVPTKQGPAVGTKPAAPAVKQGSSVGGKQSTPTVKQGSTRVTEGTASPSPRSN